MEGAGRREDYRNRDKSLLRNLVSHLPSCFLLWTSVRVSFWGPRLRGEALLCTKLLAQATLLLLGHEQLQLEVSLTALSLLGHLMQPLHVQALQLRQPQPLALLQHLPSGKRCLVAAADSLCLECHRTQGPAPQPHVATQGCPPEVTCPQHMALPGRFSLCLTQLQQESPVI